MVTKEIYEKIFNEVSLGVQVFNLERQYIYLNPALLKTLDKSLDDHLGKKMTEVYPGIENTDIYLAIEDCIKNNQSKIVNNEFLFPDGRRSFWQLRIEKTSDTIIIFSNDVTDFKEGQVLLQESNKKLEDKVEQRTKELENANLKIKKMMGYVAHDLRNPLSNIIAICELLNMPDTPKDELTEMLKTSADKTMEMVYSILNRSAIETGKIELKKRPTNIGELLNERINFYIKISGISLDNFDLNIDSQYIAEIDPYRFDQVFTNLISNALKYSDTNSQIRITLDSQGLFCLENDKESEDKLNSKMVDSIGYGVEIVETILNEHDIKLEVETEGNIFRTKFYIK